MKDSAVHKELNARYNSSEDLAHFSMSRDQSRKARRKAFMSAVQSANQAYKQRKLSQA